ncbi:MAG TPA: hypothetical protein VNH13_02130 [Candidatus Acidoferrales bacterium]|jgi:hypothetical protein|nr:hypothetical protein [Candidatus Acidoferrales bacterium]
MDLTPYLPWMKFLHVASLVVFVAGHGVSMAVLFRIRHETVPARMLALLDVSAWSLTLAGLGLLGLLLTGIVDGVVRGSFGQAWIWLSLVLLFVIAGVMTPMAGSYLTRVRAGLGQRTRALKPGDPDPTPLPPEAIAALLDTRAPEMTALVGGGGLLVILWLMTFKPF